jgi:hypothetical protein
MTGEKDDGKRLVSSDVCAGSKCERCDVVNGSYDG